MKRSSTLFIIIGAATLVGIGVVVFLMRQSPFGQGRDANVGMNDPTALPVAGVPTSLQVPSGDVIQIGTSHGIIEVKNFYRNIVAYESEFLIVVRTADYEITYDTTRSSFYVAVLVSTGPALTRGEEALLGLLGVTQSDACKLDVAEGLAGSPGSGPLSFCPGDL
ncbi:MAG: hypothetical protein A2945_01860 [Candidatus Liptonbacteria bacterium RIFCSPLOWO2_01_FULL_52_25]|uniref:Uncharacterized protein n=1 Tax=Candidatus Liptonbacteria bacterium RIFCSPLOWO2_01_FULL_52_25 TaxID=1798650 RepID=A0A1G2CEB9_9BACT|nr:MAG: hypothetical protein A2945_01860 [Candidatus Liptonbacteria bacterium RIFCSPLOWO2_01_FULL_52_25]